MTIEVNNGPGLLSLMHPQCMNEKGPHSTSNPHNQLGENGSNNCWVFGKYNDQVSQIVCNATFNWGVSPCLCVVASIFSVALFLEWVFGGYFKAINLFRHTVLCRLLKANDMYIHMHTYICIYVYIHLFIFIYIYIELCYIDIFIYLFTYIYFIRV